MQCRICGTDLKIAEKKSKQAVYCSTTCQQRAIYENYVERWLKREVMGTRGKTLQLSKHVYRYLREKFGTACSMCGWNEKHPEDGRHLTEIDHIDGNAENSFEDNLRVLCPNCHSKTPTFRNRNKNSARKR